MADLLDIAPATSVESVWIAGNQRLVVRGLGGNAIASIASRYPDLIMLLAGGPDIVPRLFTHVGGAVGPLIAAGCGHLADEKAEAIASGLLVEDQMKLLKAILNLTFPNGFGVFVALVMAMIAPTEDKPKPVRVRLRKLPSASPRSSAADLPQTLQ